MNTLTCFQRRPRRAGTRPPQVLRAVLALLASAGLLAGCGGGGDKDADPTAAMLTPATGSEPLTAMDAAAPAVAASAVEPAAPSRMNSNAATVAKASARLATSVHVTRVAGSAFSRFHESAEPGESDDGVAIVFAGADNANSEAPGKASIQSVPSAAPQTGLRTAASTDAAASTLASTFPGASRASTAPSRGKPYLERVELVANDGAFAETPISNQWAGNLPRITSHADGAVRILYQRSDPASGQIAWRLMKRPANAAQWTEEANGLSSDAVSLIRDATSDIAHVLAWPASVPTIFSGPAYAGNPVPGSWQKLPTSSRHYGGAGIGPDGTLCLKASVENPSPVPTQSTSTQYICGRYSTTARSWVWGSQVTQPINLRRAYDYIFPGAMGSSAAFTATSQFDLYKAAAGLMQLSAVAGNYSFNGISLYTSNVSSPAGWLMKTIVAPVAAPSSATAAPVERQLDAFVDIKQRVMSAYYFSDPLLSKPTGFYLNVTDGNGLPIFNGQMALPTYGNVRVFQDAGLRLWLLWTNLGTQQTQMTLYPLQEAASGSSTTFKLGAGTDLSGGIAFYGIQGSPLLAVQRNGQTPGNALDGFFAACDATFVRASLANCNPSGPDHEKIVHFRIRLPD